MTIICLAFITGDYKVAVITLMRVQYGFFVALLSETAISIAAL